MNQDVSDHEITVEEAREILGKVAEEMSDEQLQDQLSKMKYLTESWLDNYEKSIFDGKTLNEILNSSSPTF